MSASHRDDGDLIQSVIDHQQSVDPSSLDLAYKDMRFVPARVWGFSSLTSLCLDSNELTRLPNQLGCLVSLERLSIARNRLDRVPHTIGELVSLTYLSLARNELHSVPDSLCRLSRLQTLNLSRNFLVRLPEAIGSLRHLESLQVQNNLLTQLPRCTGDLSSLVDLVLEDNRLERLPRAIGRLGAMENLLIKHNPSLKYPPPHAISQCEAMERASMWMDGEDAQSDTPSALVQWIAHHPDVYSQMGRRSALWPSIRLLHIGREEEDSALSSLPMEIIWNVESYVLSDPYVPMGHSTFHHHES